MAPFFHAERDVFHFLREATGGRTGRVHHGATNGNHRPQRKVPSPAQANLQTSAAHERYPHHHRPRSLSPGPAPAGGQLPLRRGCPAAGGLHGAKPRLPAGSGPPKGGGAGQRLRGRPAGPVPAPAVRCGGDDGTWPSGGSSAQPALRCAACRAAVRDCLRSAGGRKLRRERRPPPACSGPGAGRGPVRCGHSQCPPSRAG